MKARGQNGLIGQTQLELDGIPDISLLQDTSQKFGDENPCSMRGLEEAFLPCFPAGTRIADQSAS